MGPPFSRCPVDYYLLPSRTATVDGRLMSDETSPCFFVFVVEWPLCNLGLERVLHDDD